jgi:AcrR family transcriptional regulator
MPSRQARVERSSAERIMAEAERLYGRHGLDGVSLRQIGQAAGSGNNYAVQYHFGDAAGLVRAILARRMAEVDRLQAFLLDRLEAEGGTGDVGRLVDLSLRPLLEPVDETGERVYARFIVALLNSPEGPRYFRELFHLSQTGLRIQSLILAALPQVPPAVFTERLRLVAIMVLSSVFNRAPPLHPSFPDAAQIDDALRMASAALTAGAMPGERG